MKRNEMIYHIPYMIVSNQYTREIMVDESYKCPIGEIVYLHGITISAYIFHVRNGDKYYFVDYRDLVPYKEGNENEDFAAVLLKEV